MVFVQGNARAVVSCPRLRQSQLFSFRSLYNDAASLSRQALDEAPFGPPRQRGTKPSLFRSQTSAARARAPQHPLLPCSCIQRVSCIFVDVFVGFPLAVCPSASVSRAALFANNPKALP